MQAEAQHPRGRPWLCVSDNEEASPYARCFHSPTKFVPQRANRVGIFEALRKEAGSGGQQRRVGMPQFLPILRMRG